MQLFGVYGGVILNTTNDKQNFGLPPGDGRHCLSCDCQLPGVAGLFDAAQLSLVCMLGWGISRVGIRRIRSTCICYSRIRPKFEG